MTQAEKKELLAEADRRGFNTIGTKFLSIHSDDGEERIIDYYEPNDPFITWYFDSDGALRSDNGLCTKSGCCSNPAIWVEGEWCPIVIDEPNYQIY